MEDHIVTKSNYLIEASYRINLEEQRLILAAISKVDGRRNIPDDIMITAEEYAEAFDIDMSNAYRQLQQATTDLYERDIKIYDEKTKKRKRMRWLSAVVYHDGEGRVTLSFSNKIKPYLGELNTRFTSYKLIQIKGLKSTYSIRLFELLQQFTKTGNRNIEVEWLRDYLGLEGKYPQFKDLRKWVIDAAVRELNEKTNLIVKWAPKREGRKITSLYFEFSEDQQVKMNF